MDQVDYARAVAGMDDGILYAFVPVSTINGTRLAWCSVRPNGPAVKHVYGPRPSRAVAAIGVCMQLRRIAVANGAKPA